MQNYESTPTKLQNSAGFSADWAQLHYGMIYVDIHCHNANCNGNEETRPVHVFVNDPSDTQRMPARSATMGLQAVKKRRRKSIYTIEKLSRKHTNETCCC
jgi:hypothetical protein